MPISLSRDIAVTIALRENVSRHAGKEGISQANADKTNKAMPICFPNSVKANERNFHLCGEVYYVISEVPLERRNGFLNGIVSELSVLLPDSNVSQKNFER